MGADAVKDQLLTLDAKALGRRVMFCNFRGFMGQDIDLIAIAANKVRAVLAGGQLVAGGVPWQIHAHEFALVDEIAKVAENGAFAQCRVMLPSLFQNLLHGQGSTRLLEGLKNGLFLSCFANAVGHDVRNGMACGSVVKYSDGGDVVGPATLVGQVNDGCHKVFGRIIAIDHLMQLAHLHRLRHAIGVEQDALFAA